MNPMRQQVNYFISFLLLLLRSTTISLASSSSFCSFSSSVSSSSSSVSSSSSSSVSSSSSSASSSSSVSYSSSSPAHPSASSASSSFYSFFVDSRQLTTLLPLSCSTAVSFSDFFSVRQLSMYQSSSPTSFNSCQLTNLLLLRSTGVTLRVFLFSFFFSSFDSSQHTSA